MSNNPAVVKQNLARLEKQMQASSSREFYRLGRVDRRTRRWQPPTTAADPAILGSTPLMHDRMRSDSENTAQVRRIVESLTDLVVGTGIQTFADPLEDPLLLLEDRDQLLQILSQALEMDERFLAWFTDPRQVDVSGKLDGFAMQRLAFSENVIVGDALLLRCRRPGAGPGGLCYQVLERDQLDRTRDRMGNPKSGQNRIINGVELDGDNREVAFWLFDAHPEDEYAGLSLSSQRVPAERVLHPFSVRRPSQNIGATWLSAVGQSTLDRDRFISAELQTAVKVALLALVAKRENPSAPLGIDDGLDDEDQYGNDEVALGDSPLAFNFGPNDSLEVIESNRPNNPGPFLDLLDHDTAAGSGLSYYTLTGRFAATNYTGFRGAQQIEDQHVRPIQQWFAGALARPLRREFTLQAVGANLFQTLPVGQFMRERERWLRFDCIGPGRQYLDPGRESTADAAQLRSGLTTLKIKAAQRGLHWYRLLRQRAIENRAAELLGVVLDFGSGGGGASPATTADQDDAAEDRAAAGGSNWWER